MTIRMLHPWNGHAAGDSPPLDAAEEERLVGCGLAQRVPDVATDPAAAPAGGGGAVAPAAKQVKPAKGVRVVKAFNTKGESV